MPVSPQRAEINRRKRNEQFLNSLSKLVGYSALVAIVAAVFYVIIDKMMARSRYEHAYLELMYNGEAYGSGSGNWSGIKESQPALFAPASQTPVSPDVLAEKPAAADGSSAARERGVAGLLTKTSKTVTGITDVEAKRSLIGETVRKFFEANSVVEKLAYVRDPQRVRPLMIEYYNRRPMLNLKWQSLGWTLPVDEPGFRLGYVQATFEDSAPSSLIVEELENGAFVVDWESYVRYGELSWHDFLMIRPVQPKLFRVIASKSEGGALPGTGNGHEIIEIKHPEEEGIVYATLDKNDPEMAPMVKQLQQGKWKDVPLTLRLCYPGTASDGKAVRIAGVEGKGWLILQPNRS